MQNCFASFEKSVKNSNKFANLICSQCVGPNDIFVSFEVVSLFTSVPTDQALDLILQLLANDNTLHDRTFINISDIKVGLDVCFNAAVFTCDHANYNQMFGLPMGSCISPVLSNIFMEHVEQWAISTFPTPPIFWCRYVDDTFCILNKSQTESFHQHLNSVCKHLYSDDVGRHDQRNVKKNNKAFKIKLAVTMTLPEERQNQVLFKDLQNPRLQIN